MAEYKICNQGVWIRVGIGFVQFNYTKPLESLPFVQHMLCVNVYTELALLGTQPT